LTLRIGQHLTLADKVVGNCGTYLINKIPPRRSEEDRDAISQDLTET